MPSLRELLAGPRRAGRGPEVVPADSPVEIAATPEEAVDRLLDEIVSLDGVDAALLALLDDDGRYASGFAARGVDEAWWHGITLDLEEEPSGIASVARDRTAHAVYDIEATPTVNRRLAAIVGAKSAAFVPLFADRRVNGVVIVVAKEHRFFSTAELDEIQERANEAARAFAGARSVAALHAALERERLVTQIARKVRSELDVDAILDVAVAETGRALGASRAFIGLGVPGEPMPIHAEWSAPGLDAVGDLTERLAVSNLAVRERRTVAIASVATAPELNDESLGGRDALLALGTRSALGTPIIVFDRVIGVFGLHRAAEGFWSNAEVSLAETIAAEAGLAVHTARLLDEDERRLGQQTALLKAAQVVTSDLRFESVLRRLVEGVANLVRADAVDCWMFEPDHELLRCRAVLGLPSSELRRRIVPEGTQRAAIEAGKPILKTDWTETEDPRPSPNYQQFAECVVAPITWLGEVRGVLGVLTRERGAFHSSELELIDAFARFASLAFHNAESFEERERQARIQQGFYRIAEVLGSPLSLAETLNALAEAAAEALGGAAAVVLHPADGGLRLEGAYRLPPTFAERLSGGVAAGATPFLDAAREERIVSSSGVADDDRFDEEWRALLAEHRYRSLLSAPVAGASGENQAVVVLFGQERSFSDDDLALARHLSRAARGALERSELFETERRARSLSQQLADVGARLATNLDPAVVLDEVVVEAPALLGADAAAIRLLEGDELVVRAATGAGASGIVGMRSTSGTGIAGDVAQSRTPSTVEDVRAASHLVRGDPLLAKGAGASVAVPMFAHGGGLHGVLSVYAAAARAWSEDEVQALVALAAVASAALSSAELYQRVTEEKERSEAILGNIADGIVAVDREGRIVLWNSMAERITGVPAAEALGRRVAETLQRELASEGEPGGEREIAITRGGKEVWLSLTEAAMRDASGGVAGRIFAFRDVSSERAVEEMKSDFVATVSLELRTPLTSIYGFAETLLRSDVGFGREERETFLGYISSESERLIRIVDDLLDVARLDAGTLGVATAPTDVADVVREVVGWGEATANGSRTFVVDVPDGSLVAHADREKLAEVVRHLVDNAIKFSPAGGTITVAGRRRSDTVEVRVGDEGAGIAAAERNRIFTKFYRGDGAGTNGSAAAAGGTGLGLFLVRGLLAAMNGRIWVESEEGSGSTFVFELPVARSREEDAV